LNRRDFARTTAMAAAGIAAWGSRAAAALRDHHGLVDTNVSLGRWPFRRLPLDDTTKLVAKLRQQGATQAWAGSFDAAFGKDIANANAQLAVDCRRFGHGLLVPFGSVNLASPEWKPEFWRCLAVHRMPGLRLFPNYHGYKLEAAAFREFLALATENKIVVQIATDLEDERTQPASTAVPHVNAGPLVALLEDQPRARVILLNWHRAVKPPLVKQLARLGVCFDIATVENVGGVGKLIEEVSVDQVVFGSHAPFFYFDSARLKLKESALTETQVASVCELNARRWFT